MNESKKYGKCETVLNDFKITEVYVLPAKLDVNKVTHVRMDKINNKIMIGWTDKGKDFFIKGTYRDYIPAILMLKQQIVTRENPEERLEMWECVNDHGVYDLDIENKLKKMRRIK